MSLKEIKRKVEIEVTEKCLFCDACGERIPSGKSIINLAVKKNYDEDVMKYGMKPVWIPKLDICSVECLTKNIGAIGLQFNVKFLHEDDEKSLSKDEGSYDKEWKQV